MSSFGGVGGGSSSAGGSSSGGSGSGSSAAPVLMLGSHRVHTLDDISKYSDSIVANFQALKDGRAEANFAQQGLKSDAEIQSYSLDEGLVGLERLRFFLFSKQATHLQRMVGIDSIMRECTRTVRDREGATSAEEEGQAARSASGALAYAAAAVSSSVLSASPSAAPSAGWHLELSDDGPRLLEQLLPELHRAIPLWDWDLQTRVATLYCDLLTARLMPRPRLMESVVLPFLLRMLEQDDMSEEYVSVWMQPLLCAIDALGALPANAARGTPAQPASQFLHTTVLEFSMKKSKRMNIKETMLSQPINVRILCVHLWGQLCKHLHWKVIQDHLLDPALSLCQDTSGAVRFHMCRHLVTLIHSLSPATCHARHAPSPSNAPSADSDSDGCPLCPPLPPREGDARYPLALLLVELEELLKDEERDCRTRAFHTLVGVLDAFPDSLRRSAVIPLVRSFVHLPPKGMMHPIAQSFGHIIWKLRGDLLGRGVAEPVSAAVASSAAAAAGGGGVSSARGGAAAVGGNGEVAQVNLLVRALIAFYKNLLYLSASSSSSSSSSSDAAASSASIGGTHAQLLSPVSAALQLGRSGDRSASLNGVDGSSTASLSHGGGHANNSSSSINPSASEPRRCCAASFVAVLSILGRVGATPPTSSSPSPFSLVPESRFFLEHLSGVWGKLLKDEDAEVRLLVASSFFEVVHVLAGVGSSISRAGVMQAHNAAATAAGVQAGVANSVSYSAGIPVTSAPATHMRKSSSTATILPAAASNAAPLPPSPPPHLVLFHTSSTAAASLLSTSSNSTSAPSSSAASSSASASSSSSSSSSSPSPPNVFKLTRDAFFGFFQDVAQAAAQAQAQAQAQAAQPTGQGSALQQGATGARANATAAASSPSFLSFNVNAASTASSPSLAASLAPAAHVSLPSALACVHALLEGGKLQSICDAFYRAHFGCIAPAAAAGTAAAGTATALGGGSTAAASYPIPEPVLDSWSSFLSDLLRALLMYESALSLPGSASASAWRMKQSLWSAAEFLFRPSLLSEGREGSATGVVLPPPPRGFVPLRPSYFSAPLHVSSFHSSTDLGSYAFFFDKLLPLLLAHMHHAPLPLKSLALRIVLGVLCFAPLACRRAEVHARLLREFGASRSYWDRETFIRMCRSALGLGEHSAPASTTAYPPALPSLLRQKPLSDRLFKKLLFLPLVALLSDPVASIRRHFALRQEDMSVVAESAVGSVDGKQQPQHSPLLLVRLKSMLRLPQDQVLADALGHHVASWQSSFANQGAGDKHTQERVKQVMALYDATELSTTAASTVDPSERRREEFEESLLRAEEAWMGDERHRHALVHSGTNSSLALQALQAASSFVPLVFDAKSGSCAPILSASNVDGSAGGVGGSVAGRDVLPRRKGHQSHSSMGHMHIGNLKALQDSIMADNAGPGVGGGAGGGGGGGGISKRRSLNMLNLPNGGSGSGGGLGGGAGGTAGASGSGMAGSTGAGGAKPMRRLGSASPAPLHSVAAAPGSGRSARTHSVGDGFFPGKLASIAAPAQNLTSDVPDVSGVEARQRKFAALGLGPASSNLAPLATNLPPRASSAAPLSSAGSSSPPVSTSALGRRINTGISGVAPISVRSSKLISAQSHAAAAAASGSSGTPTTTTTGVGALPRTRPPVSISTAGSSAASLGSGSGGGATPTGPASSAGVASPVVSAHLSSSSSSSSSSASNSPRAAARIGARPGPRFPVTGGAAAAGTSAGAAFTYGVSNHGSLAGSGSLSERSYERERDRERDRDRDGGSGASSPSLSNLDPVIPSAGRRQPAAQRGVISGRHDGFPHSHSGAGVPPVSSSPPPSYTHVPASSLLPAASPPSLGPALPGPGKLYAHEPLAHAHLRKFKLSQRAALPSADTLRSEANRIKQAASSEDATSATSSGGAHIGVGMSGVGLPLHSRRAHIGSALPVRPSPRERLK